MRVVEEFLYQDCKVTVFSWNNKYLIKLEQGMLEQTFKVNEYDLINEEEVKEILNEEFMVAAKLRFKEMNESLAKAMLGR